MLIKYSWFRLILEIFLRNLFYSCVKFSRSVSTAKLFNNEILPIYGLKVSFSIDIEAGRQLDSKWLLYFMYFFIT